MRILSILDDATRFVLAALVIASKSLGAAVATFRRAAVRWRLPEKLYADRGSAYDDDCPELGRPAGFAPDRGDIHETRHRAEASTPFMA